MNKKERAVKKVEICIDKMIELLDKIEDQGTEDIICRLLDNLRDLEGRIYSLDTLKIKR